MTTFLPALSTFRARLTLRWTLAVGLLLGVANLVIYAGADLYLQRWLDSHVRTLAATEAASSTDGVSDVHLHEAPFAQLETGVFSEKLVQIFDASGRLVLQSTALEGLPPVIGPEVVSEALAGRAPMVSAEVGGRQLRMAVLQASRDDKPYAIAVGMFIDDIEQGLASLAWLLGTVWAAGVAATAASGYVLARRALAPISRITERAGWIAGGNFEVRLDTPAVDDEVGRMTRLLNSMLDRLEQAIEANRRFASDASHELRTPLTAIAGELDVTLRHKRTAEHYEETLRQVRDRLSDLIRVAEDLILLTRTQEGTRDVLLREIDLDAIVGESFERLADLARAGTVTLERSGLSGVRVYADPVLIMRVIDNVIANGICYNRDGGRVMVRAAVEEPAVDDWTSAMVQLDVEDTGVGIPRGDHERIFDRFCRLDRSRTRHSGGSGLGLAICREVLALMGGTIRVGASSPEGTRFEIRLPGVRVAAPHQT
jgi:signal transduction histidine kinase